MLAFDLLALRADAVKIAQRIRILSQPLSPQSTAVAQHV